MKKQSIKAVLILTILCAVVAAILGTANYFTAAKIAENAEKTRTEARSAVLPDGEYTFREADISAFGDSSVTAAWEAQKNGETVYYVFQMETKGYATGLILMCGVDKDGKITGTKTVSSSETPSLGGKTDRDAYREQYIGLTKGQLGQVEGIAGATKTSEAYRNAASDALNAFGILTGGDN